jgi:hypothetical protein
MMNIITVNYPPPSSPFTPRSASDITQRAIHHSAGPITQTPLEIDAFERSRTDQASPFIYIPYCYLAGPTGNDYTKPVLYTGRPALVEEGATFGQHLQSLSICCLGNFQSDSAGYTGPPTQELLDLLSQWMAWTQTQFPSISRTVSHSETAVEEGYTDQCCGNTLIAALPKVIIKGALLYQQNTARGGSQ